MKIILAFATFIAVTQGTSWEIDRIEIRSFRQGFWKMWVCQRTGQQARVCQGHCWQLGLSGKCKNVAKLKCSDNWTFVQYESSYNTGATNDNTNGSRDYGIFQINDNYWCDANVGYGADCNVSCNK